MLNAFRLDGNCKFEFFDFQKVFMSFVEADDKSELSDHDWFSSKSIQET